MISKVVPDCFHYVEEKIYEWERNLPGLDKTTGSHSAVSRIAAGLVVVVDCSLEVLNPAFSSIECAAFAAFSLLASVYHLLRFQGRAFVIDLRCMVVNVYDGIHSVAVTMLKVTFVPFFFIAQLSLTLADQQKAQSSYKNFYEVPVLTDNEYDEETDPAYCFAFSRVQSNWYHLENTLAKSNKVGQLIAYPFGYVLSEMDVVFEILKKFCLTIECTIRSVLILMKAPVWYAIGKNEDVAGEVRRAFSIAHHGTDAFARLITDVALIKIIWVCQFIAIVFDPKHVKRFEKALHSPYDGDICYRLNGLGSLKEKVPGESLIIKQQFKYDVWEAVEKEIAQ